LITELQIHENKRMRKKVKPDGSVVHEEMPEIDPRKLGNSYLNLLRNYNEGKPRKNPEDRSSSMMDLAKKPKIDYLR
jgi:hypothetical protein